MASNAENFSVWWRHHGTDQCNQTWWLSSEPLISPRGSVLSQLALSTYPYSSQYDEIDSIESLIHSTKWLAWGRNVLIWILYQQPLSKHKYIVDHYKHTTHKTRCFFCFGFCFFNNLLTVLDPQFVNSLAFPPIKIHVMLTIQRQPRCVNCWNLPIHLHCQLSTHDPATPVIWVT